MNHENMDGYFCNPNTSTSRLDKPKKSKSNLLNRSKNNAILRQIEATDIICVSFISLFLLIAIFNFQSFMAVMFMYFTFPIIKYGFWIILIIAVIAYVKLRFKYGRFRRFF